MTVEKVIYVRIPSNLCAEFVAIDQKAGEALRRSTKLPPGDTTEIERFEALCSLAERSAAELARSGAPFIVDDAGNSPGGAGFLLEKKLMNSINLPSDGLPVPVQSWINQGEFVVRLVELSIA